jgi:hypothetical protein
MIPICNDPTLRASPAEDRANVFANEEEEEEGGGNKTSLSSDIETLRSNLIQRGGCCLHCQLTLFEEGPLGAVL